LLLNTFVVMHAQRGFVGRLIEWHARHLDQHYGKFWDTNTQGPDIKVDHMGSRPGGHHHTSSAHPPRCLVRC
jgi:hypothetical protein